MSHHTTTQKPLEDLKSSDEDPGLSSESFHAALARRWIIKIKEDMEFCRGAKYPDPIHIKPACPPPPPVIALVLEKMETVKWDEKDKTFYYKPLP